MADAAIDLWPAIEGDPVRTPLSILREQASLLGPKTQHLVEAEVSTTSNRDNLVHEFYVVAPALDHYRYHLLTVAHGIELYPLEMWPPRGDPAEADDEDAFLKRLGSFLASEHTRNVVRSLYSQSQSPEDFRDPSRPDPPPMPADPDNPFGDQ